MSADQNTPDSGKNKSRLTAAAAAIGITSALALAAVFNVPAHVPSEEKNKQQHDLLAPYAGFVMHMEKANGGHCCGMQDGMGKIPEKHTDYPAKTDAEGRLRADPAGTHYHVKVVKDQNGNELPNGGIWLDIPDENIVGVPQLEKVKEKYPDDQTLKAPPFNVLWTNNSFPTAANPETRPYIYCLWPTPRIQ
jgi:hypothetical protein